MVLQLYPRSFVRSRLENFGTSMVLKPERFFIFLICVMINKIVASGINVCTNNCNYGTIPSDCEVILFDKEHKIKHFNNNYELDRASKQLLITLCTDHLLFLSTRFFRESNKGMIGYIQISYGSDFEYTIFLLDGEVQMEVLTEGGMVQVIKEDNKFNMIDKSKLKQGYLINYILYKTEYGLDILGSLNNFITYDFLSSQILLYPTSGIHSNNIDKYNKYLFDAGWEREIQAYNYDKVKNTSTGDIFSIYSEGSGFKRFITIISCIEEAKNSQSSLIIDNFGDGLDVDKCDFLYNLIIEYNINVILGLN